MNGRATATKDYTRRSHRRQREGEVSKTAKMADVGGGADRLRRKRYHLPPSQVSLEEEEEEEEEDVVKGDISGWVKTKRQRARASQVKSVEANERPLDFTKVSSIRHHRDDLFQISGKDSVFSPVL